MSNRYKHRNHRQRAHTPWLAITILAGLILLGLTTFLSWRGQSRPGAAIEVSGRPSLKVSQETIDLGNVRLGQTVQASFELTNVGDRPLRFAEAPYIEVVEGC